MGKKLYYNGIILTAAEHTVQLDAVLTEDGIIKKVFQGDIPEQERNAPDIEKIDLEGKTMVPGFIDGHSHFLQNAQLWQVMNANTSPLGESDSVEQLVESLKMQMKNAPFKDQEYLYARGYDEAVYPDHRLPTRYDLDQVTDKPLAVTHISGHNTVFNSAALAMAGITDNYTPRGDGSVGRFPDGTLTGVFHENAVRDVMPEVKKDEWKILQEGIESAVLQYASVGITTAQDGGTSPKWYGYAQQLADNGKLPFDLASYVIGDGVEELLEEKKAGETGYRNHYRAAGLKIFLDGSPQAKTAWLSKPYKIPPADQDASYCGYGTHSDEELEAIIKQAVLKHWQINVHTNGDEAIEQLIRVYRKVLDETGEQTDLRPVSIHCQTVREDQLLRMKETGILASFFVDHTFYWGDYHRESVLGAERAERISPLASAIKHGISFSIHQDTPVTRQDPIFAIHNAVNRKTRSGSVLGAEFCISPWEALKAVTINAAYQLFEEKDKGSIEEGKRADFAILSDNPLTVPTEKIREIYVLKTIKDGEAIYDREKGLL